MAFNWSSLDHSKLHKILLELEPQIIKRPINPEDFYKTVASHLRKSIPIRVRKNISKKIFRGYIFLGGRYYSDRDITGHKCIELIITYNPQDSYIKFSKIKFKKLCNLFADTIMHELIHMRQYRKRGHKIITEFESYSSNKDQRYFGNRDEIEAYAYNIACELERKFKGNKEKIHSYLQENNPLKLKGWNNWIVYMKTFQFDHTHPVIKHIKKKIIRFINRKSLEKPFTSNLWISN